MILEIFRCVYYQNPSPWNFHKSISCENFNRLNPNSKNWTQPGICSTTMPIYEHGDGTHLLSECGERVKVGSNRVSERILSDTLFEPTWTHVDFEPTNTQNCCFSQCRHCEKQQFWVICTFRNNKRPSGGCNSGRWGMRRDLIPSHNSTEFKRVYSANGIVEPQSGKICIQGVRKRYSDWNLIILR